MCMGTWLNETKRSPCARGYKKKKDVKRILMCSYSKHCKFGKDKMEYMYSEYSVIHDGHINTIVVAFCCYCCSRLKPLAPTNMKRACKIFKPVGL